MPMMDYRKVVVGADGCELAAPVVGRASSLARGARRRRPRHRLRVLPDARAGRSMNVRTLGGDPRSGQVLAAEDTPQS